MRRLIQWVVDHTTTVSIAALCIVLFGWLSYSSLPRESSPDITIPVVIITTPYVGVSPEDVENLISVPLENELASLKNVKEMSSTSAEGISIVVLEFDPDTVIEDALQRVRDRVSRARSKLPDDAEDSDIREISFSDVPVVLITIAGSADEEALKALGEDLKDDISRVPGVLDVTLTGGTEREVRVEVIPHRLAHYGLSLNDIVGAINNENVNIPGGNVDVGRGNVLLRVPGEFEDIDDIASVAIKRVGDRPVFIRDVARVIDGREERQSYSRMAGQSAVTLGVTKRAGANILNVATTAKQTADGHAALWPEGVTHRALGDQSLMIERMVNDLQNNIITALILVVGVIVIVMGWRPSLFVALAIPTSMLGSMFVLDALGFTLNMVVLFSLILALGMLVDNAIVVVENVYRHREMGKSPASAAVDGTDEVATAVATSTATTVAAFFPLVFWTGIMGEFMGFMPKTVIIVLIASLITAVCFLPVAMAKLLPASAPTGRDLSDVDMRNAELGSIMSRYRTLLRLAIRRRYAALGLAFASLFVTVTIFCFANHGTEFFPETEPERAIVGVRLPLGTDVNSTDRIVRMVERILATEDNVDTWVADVGVSATGDALQGATARPNEARIVVDFHPDRNSVAEGQQVRIESTFETVDRLRERVSRIPGAKIAVDPQQEGPPVGKPINIELSGEDYDAIGEIAVELRRAIERGVAGTADMEDDYDVGRPELRLRIDRGAAKRVGVSTAEVGNTVRTAIAGTVATTLRDGEDETDVRVQLAPQYREDLQQVLSLRLPGREDTSPDTFPVPISSVAQAALAGGSSGINHIDQDLVVTISGDIAEGFNDNAVRAEVAQFVDDYGLPDHVKIRLTGADQEQEESIAFLSRAFGIAIALILLVLVTQFDSLAIPAIIVTTVLLSLVGVLWGLLLTGTPFGIIMTGIGVISLAGVVVNNAIVLLDYVQQLIDRGLSVDDALVEAGLTRFRPVMLTAITTALGLIPMAIGISFDFINIKLIIGSVSAQWWGPMAVAVIFGLAFATVLTLVVVPTLYGIYNDFVHRTRFRWFSSPPVATTALCIVFATLPGEAGATSLQDAWHAAESADLTYAMANEAANEQRTIVGQAWARISPRLTGSAGYVINDREIAFDSFGPPPPTTAPPSDPFIIQEKTFLQANLTLTQRLFGGTSIAGLRSAYGFKGAAEQDRRTARQQSRVRVASAFYGVLAAKEAVEVAKNAHALAEAQQTLADRQHEAGLADRRALIQARLGVSRAERDVLAAEERWTDARTGFQLLTGLNGDDLEVPPPFSVPTNLEEAQREARATRPDLKAAGFREKALRRQTRAHDLRWLPVVDGIGSLDYTQNEGFFDRRDSWRIVIQASWDLWDGGARMADRATSAAQWRSARLAEALLQQDVDRSVQLALEAHRQAEAALRSVDDELALAEENVALAEASFEAGAATWLDVDAARLQLQSVQLSRLDQRTRRDLAAVNVLLQTGAL